MVSLSPIYSRSWVLITQLSGSAGLYAGGGVFVFYFEQVSGPNALGGHFHEEGEGSS